MNDRVERIVKVKPVHNACQYSIFPVYEQFLSLVQKQCSIMFFVGQITGFWRYENEVDIEVIPADLNKILKESPNSGILGKTLLAVEILHYRNRENKSEQIKDLGRIIWILEENIHRRDHFCPKCSQLIKIRFSDLMPYCGICKTKLEYEKYTPPRFLKKKKTY